jgi:hypothetical protein
VSSFVYTTYLSILPLNPGRIRGMPPCDWTIGRMQTKQLVCCAARRMPPTATAATHQYTPTNLKYLGYLKYIDT